MRFKPRGLFFIQPLYTETKAFWFMNNETRHLQSVDIGDFGKIYELHRYLTNWHRMLFRDLLGFIFETALEIEMTKWCHKLRCSTIL